MFNTMDDARFRGTVTSQPRMLEGEDRTKFVTAVRSPMARQALNFDVPENIITLLQGEINQMSITLRTKLRDMMND